MTTAEGLFVAVRTIHFAATLALFGEIVFRLLASRPLHASVNPSSEAPEIGQHRLHRALIAVWLIGMLSGICWLLLAASFMSGRGLKEGWDLPLLETVAERTSFGQEWSVRLMLALALAVVWATACRPRVSHRPAAWRLAAVLSGAVVVGLAWAGHANAEGGKDGAIHHFSDGVHLLAAGAWLGGLAPLMATMRRLGPSPNGDDLDLAARMVRRFGALAAGCVGLLLGTGLINAGYTLRSAMALVDTSYGHLLLVKLILFAGMLAIGAANRARLTPALSERNGDPATRLAAARRLRCNAYAEQALGFGILVLVGALGVSSPPMSG